jgi:hypothetical protein
MLAVITKLQEYFVRSSAVKLLSLVPLGVDCYAPSLRGECLLNYSGIFCTESLSLLPLQSFISIST